MANLSLLSIFLICLQLHGMQFVHSKDYSKHVVVSVESDSPESEELIRNLIEEGLATSWTHPRGGKQHLVVDDKIMQFLKNKKLDVEQMLNAEQIISQFEAVKKRNNDARAPELRHNVTWMAYNTLDEIYEYMDELAAANPTVASVSVLGTTWEGRQLKMLTIANGGDDPSRPMIVLDAGIHAREWIAPATATYIMDQLVQDSLINNATFVVVPSLNPDGYEFTWSGDRLWRKTRSDRPENRCIGVDGNRNWNFHWMEVGASNISCSEVYAGPYPNSEPEFQALADFVRNANTPTRRVQAYVTMHSYSQLFMFPWGDTYELPPTATELDRVAAKAVDALTAVHGTVYEHNSTANILGYLDAGTSRDYMYAVENIPYVYTIELRDTGTYDFELPADQILPTGEETWPAFRVVAEEALLNM